LRDVQINDLLGLPYKRGARGPNAYDCYGLCIEVCRRAGVILPEIETPILKDARNELFASTKDVWVKLAQPQLWCLAAFFIKRRWHAGVVLPGLNSFIHVTSGINVSVSQLANYKWRQRFDGFYVPNNANTQSV
jgi:cell wall-associated NlpC family hydrolase